MDPGARDMTETRTRIVIGVITRRRPQLFEGLLDSLAALHCPGGAALEFVFVENDDALRCAEAVARFRARVPGPVTHVQEPRRGIPMARNRVLDLALESGASFLAFVDDDETVAPDWIVAHLDASESRGLDLGGGPIRLEPPQGALSRMQSAVLEEFRYKVHREMRSRRGHAARGSDGHLDAYTNNWFARLDTVRRLGLRFDESLAASGGEDTRFSMQMRAAGARTGWVDAAQVSEVMPRNRLTLSYLFRRNRDQASLSIQLARKSQMRAMRTVPLQLILAVLIAALTPVLGFRALARATRKAGVAMGRARGAMGLRSTHYAAENDAAHVETHPPRR